MIIMPHIHRSAIGMRNVRFYMPPKDPTELPWVSADDLLTALTYPRRERLGIKQAMRLHREWSAAIMSVKDDGKKSDIVPHWIAQGLMDAAKDDGRAVIETEIAFNNGLMDAFVALRPTLTREQIMRQFEAALIAHVSKKEKSK